MKFQFFFAKSLCVRKSFLDTEIIRKCPKFIKIYTMSTTTTPTAKISFTKATSLLRTCILEYYSDKVDGNNRKSRLSTQLVSLLASFIDKSNITIQEQIFLLVSILRVLRVIQQIAVADREALTSISSTSTQHISHRTLLLPWVTQSLIQEFKKQRESKRIPFSENIEDINYISTSSTLNGGTPIPIAFHDGFADGGISALSTELVTRLNVPWRSTFSSTDVHGSIHAARIAATSHDITIQKPNINHNEFLEDIAGTGVWNVSILTNLMVDISILRSSLIESELRLQETQKPNRFISTLFDKRKKLSKNNFDNIGNESNSDLEIDDVNYSRTFEMNEKVDFLLLKGNEKDLQRSRGRRNLALVQGRILSLSASRIARLLELSVVDKQSKSNFIHVEDIAKCIVSLQTSKLLTIPYAKSALRKQKKDIFSFEWAESSEQLLRAVSAYLANIEETKSDLFFPPASPVSQVLSTLESLSQLAATYTNIILTNFVDKKSSISLEFEFQNSWKEILTSLNERTHESPKDVSSREDFTFEKNDCVLSPTIRDSVSTLANIIILSQSPVRRLERLLLQTNSFNESSLPRLFLSIANLMRAIFVLNIPKIRISVTNISKAIHGSKRLLKLGFALLDKDSSQRNSNLGHELDTWDNTSITISTHISLLKTRTLNTNSNNYNFLCFHLLESIRRRAEFVTKHMLVIFRNSGRKGTDAIKILENLREAPRRFNPDLLPWKILKNNETEEVKSTINQLQMNPSIYENNSVSDGSVDSLLLSLNFPMVKTTTLKELSHSFPYSDLSFIPERDVQQNMNEQIYFPLSVNQIISLIVKISTSIPPYFSSNLSVSDKQIHQMASETLHSLGDAFCALALAGETTRSDEIDVLIAFSNVGIAHRGVFIACGRRIACGSIVEWKYNDIHKNILVSNLPNTQQLLKAVHSLCIGWIHDTDAMTIVARNLLQHHSSLKNNNSAIVEDVKKQNLLRMQSIPSTSLGNRILQSLSSFSFLDKEVVANSNKSFISSVLDSASPLSQEILSFLRLKDIDDSWSKNMSTKASVKNVELQSKEDFTEAILCYLPNIISSLKCAAATSRTSSDIGNFRKLDALATTFSHIFSQYFNKSDIFDVSAMHVYGIKSIPSLSSSSDSNFISQVTSITSLNLAVHEVSRVFLITQLLQIIPKRNWINIYDTLLHSQTNSENDINILAISALFFREIYQSNTIGTSASFFTLLEELSQYNFMKMHDSDNVLNATVVWINNEGNMLTNIEKKTFIFKLADKIQKYILSVEKNDKTIISQLQLWNSCEITGLFLPLSILSFESKYKIAFEFRLPSHSLYIPPNVANSRSGLQGQLLAVPNLTMMWRTTLLSQANWYISYIDVEALLIQNEPNSLQTAQILKHTFPK